LRTSVPYGTHEVLRRHQQTMHDTSMSIMDATQQLPTQ